MPYQHPLIPPNWIGYRLGLEAPRVKHLGEATIVRTPLREDAGYLSPPDSSPPPVINRYAEQVNTVVSQPLRALDFRTRQQYRLVPEPGTGPLLRNEFQKKAGVENPAQVSEIQDLMLIDGGGVFPIVSGEDDRVRIQPTNAFPYSALIHLTVSVSSGALIADNVVLTAAHCVVNGGIHQNPGYEEIWYDNVVIPGMDRNPQCAPGDAGDACKRAPFGRSAVNMALVPEGWLAPKGGPSPGDGPGGVVQHDPEDWVDDIAVLILEERLGQQTGTFDYRALSAPQLQNAAFLNRAYPSPFGQPLPDGYQPWQMWGDQNYCFVEDFLGFVDGIHHLFQHDADTSPGHSGSPIYQWHVSLDQGWRPEIAGVMSHHAFGNNYARRIVEQDLLVDLGFSIGLDVLTQ